MEIYEADYMITCLEEYNGDQRPAIIRSQLDDLGLKFNKDYFVFHVGYNGNVS
jgi:hypothetical protein